MVTANHGQEEADHPVWIDELVDLHVLAEHGDNAAAATARHWMASDPDACRLWDQVDRTCDRLRGLSQ